ncbi:MAG: AbrB/MazE/SpoVT family DNA-binding domain-containing protein [bacterium]
MVTTHITRIGNSKGIIVPSLVVKSLALDEGDEVELEYDEDAQILKCSFPSTKQLKLISAPK